jgi:hypothetical protein
MINFVAFILSLAILAAGHPFQDAVAPAVFPVNNPLNITEREAREWNITLYPIDDEAFYGANHNAKIEERQKCRQEPDGHGWCRNDPPPWCSFVRLCFKPKPHRRITLMRLLC